MNKVIRHIRRWNIWRKRSCNGWFYKLLVLLGITRSPTLQTVWLPEDIAAIEHTMNLLSTKHNPNYYEEEET
jgi:hypothetical protein